MKTPEKNTTSPLPALRILWGRKIGAKDHEEQILLTDVLPFQSARFVKVRELAARDGFGHFRETVDNGTAPDFTGMVRG